MRPKEVNTHLKLPCLSPEKKKKKCVGLESSGNSLTLLSIVPKANADQYTAIHTTTGTTLVKGYSFFSVFSLHFSRAEEDEEMEKEQMRRRERERRKDRKGEREGER